MDVGADDSVSTQQGLKAVQHIQQGRGHLTKNHFGPAAALLLSAARLVPELCGEIIEDLVQALDGHSRVLAASGDPAGAITAYGAAVKALPPACRSERLLLQHRLGVLYYALGDMVQATALFRACVEAAPGFTAARESLEAVLNHTVDRWHFRMLNDKARNEAYKGAIHAAVAELRSQQKPSGKGSIRCVDIGAGTGILSILAAQGGAEEVFAVESAKVFCQVAQECVSKNGCSDAVRVLHKRSDEIDLSRDMAGRKADLIVTELVDSGLLGEHIIPTLHHARENLLAPGGKVIPYGAKVYAVAIESPELRAQKWLQDQETNTALRTPSATGSRPSAREGPHVAEPYTCVLLAHMSHRLMSESFEAINIHFGSAVSGEGAPVEEVEVQVIQDGQIDAIAIWFDLYLDQNKKYVVSTAPEEAGTNGWDQGVYFLPNPVKVKKGDVLLMGVAALDDRLSFVIDTEESLQEGEHKTSWPSEERREGLGDLGMEIDMEIDTEEGLPGMGTAPVDDGFEVGEMDMCRLNDPRWSIAYTMSVQDAIKASTPKINGTTGTDEP